MGGAGGGGARGAESAEVDAGTGASGTAGAVGVVAPAAAAAIAAAEALAGSAAGGGDPFALLSAAGLFVFVVLPAPAVCFVTFFFTDCACSFLNSSIAFSSTLSSPGGPGDMLSLFDKAPDVELALLAAAAVAAAEGAAAEDAAAEDAVAEDAAVGAALGVPALLLGGIDALEGAVAGAFGVAVRVTEAFGAVVTDAPAAAVVGALFGAVPVSAFGVAVADDGTLKAGVSFADPPEPPSAPPTTAAGTDFAAAEVPVVGFFGAWLVLLFLFGVDFAAPDLPFAPVLLFDSPEAPEVLLPKTRFFIIFFIAGHFL